jgi:uncharacterized membrane protein SpoIIM required for sporulation
MAETFIEKGKGKWKRLEELIGQARSVRGLRKLTRDELRELMSTYRRASADLATAREESRDQRLINYLNNLVIRAHGMIYRSESKGVRSIIDFYRYEFPLIFRKTYRYTLSIFLVFVAIAICSFVATWRNDDFASFAHLSSGTVQEIKAGHRWWEVLNKLAPVGAAKIITNNIQVGIMTFSLSILPVVGTVLVLTPSALMFGSINALIIKYGMTRSLWAFVAGHAVLEFMAIFIAGGAGLMIGLALLIPGERTRRDALIEQGKTSIKLMAGCFPMFFIAGLIEAFISPLPIHPGYRFAVSAITAVMLIAYLVKSDKRK